MEVEEEPAGAPKRKSPRVGGEEVKEEEEAVDEEMMERDFCGGYEKELRLLQEDDEYGCDEEGGGGITEEAVAEVMLWLEAEISDGARGEEPAGFVTINANEESCGPSFSCAASTVMASVDTRAGAPPPPLVPWPFPAEAKEMVASKEDDEAADDYDYDEAWLAELLLACGPALEGIQEY